MNRKQRPLVYMSPIREAVDAYWRRWHCPPSIRDIQRMLELDRGRISTSVIRAYLIRLQLSGELESYNPPVPVWVGCALRNHNVIDAF